MTAVTAESLAWQGQAACRYDPDLFFSEGDPAAPAVAAQIERAKQVCAGCPVRRACLEWAMARNEKEGIWGGLDEGERQRARRLRMRRRREYAA
jgi:WhiB family redox-sensing transcriptional regulator